ncbi:zinc-ribbon domain-containing protein [Geodermatophilus sp. SYSU D01180]
MSEDLVAEFVRNLSRPDRDVDSTPSGAQDRILWRCRQAHEWEAVARQRVKYGTQCPTCLAGLWTSRLEHQVAALVELTTGLEVQVGARTPRTDRAADEAVDLLVVELDVLVDLDPSRWHGDEAAVARDLRKLDRLAGRRYVRVRPQGLGLLPSDRARPEQQVLLGSTEEGDAWEWAATVVRALRTFGLARDAGPPTAEDRAAALVRADRRWRSLRAGTRRRSLATDFPVVAGQLVEVVGGPGLTAADLAPSGDDRAVWRCPDCGHTWEARVANRTVGDTGCPPCSYRRGAARAATPRPGASFADHHPELVAYFVEDLTSPGKTPFDLKPNSIDRCRWSCPHCGRPWMATPQSLHRRPGGGCRICGHGRALRARRTSGGRGGDERGTDRRSAQPGAALAVELGPVKGHGHPGGAGEAAVAVQVRLEGDQRDEDGDGEQQEQHEEHGRASATGPGGLPG